MKKICVILVLLLSLQMCTTAYADTTSKNDMLTIQDLISERVNNDKLEPFEMNEAVTVQEQCVFTLTNLTIAASDRSGMMDVLAYLNVKSLVENLSLADFDFMLVEQVKGGDDEYHLPEAVYGDVYGQYQQFAWPVAISTEHEMELVFRYTVAKDTPGLGLMYTSIISDGQEYRSTDDLKVYIEFRTPMDFIFKNSLDKTITELYVVPASDRSWGKNLLNAYNDPTLMSGYWMEVEFADTVYEERTGESWEMRIVFEDGTYATFSEIDLDECVQLELFPDDEEGRYTIQTTR